MNKINIALKDIQKPKFIWKNNSKFFIFERRSKLYKILIPNNIQFYLQKGTSEISFICNTEIKEHKKFFQILEEIIHKEEKSRYRKLLFFKGLGFKVSSEQKNLISLKLGYSHLINYKIPNAINFIIKDNTLLLESNDKVLLGDITHKIQDLKEPNIYKGKGIWQKYQICNLKEIKKK